MTFFLRKRTKKRKWNSKQPGKNELINRVYAYREREAEQTDKSGCVGYTSSAKTFSCYARTQTLGVTDKLGRMVLRGRTTKQRDISAQSTICKLYQ